MLTGIGVHVYHDLTSTQAQEWASIEDRGSYGECGNASCLFGSNYKAWVLDTVATIKGSRTDPGINSPYIPHTYDTYYGLGGNLFMATIFTDGTEPVFYKTTGLTGITRQPAPVTWAPPPVGNSAWGTLTMGGLQFSVDSNNQGFISHRRIRDTASAPSIDYSSRLSEGLWPGVLRFSGIAVGQAQASPWPAPQGPWKAPHLPRTRRWWEILVMSQPYPRKAKNA